METSIWIGVEIVLESNIFGYDIYLLRMKVSLNEQKNPAFNNYKKELIHDIFVQLYQGTNFLWHIDIAFGSSSPNNVKLKLFHFLQKETKIVSGPLFFCFFPLP